MGNNYFGKTDIGMRRATNQDYFAVKALDEELVLMVVCDGMGGAAGGSEASSLAVKTFVQYVSEQVLLKEKSEYLQLLENALELANEAVCKKAKTSTDLKGMGTTLVCALFDGESYYCLWIGDSRIYAITEKELIQLSHDHSFVQSLIDSKRITKEEARTHPNRNIITKAVGIDEGVSADVCKAASGDICGVLLCSDGLCGYVAEDKIFSFVNQARTCEEACDKLIAAANDEGGPDNITVVIHKKQ